MTSWADGPLLSLDLESTDRNPLVARAVTISLVIVHPGCPKATTLEWLVAVDEEIPSSASEVHGITTEYARENGSPLAGVLTELDTALREAWRPDVPLIAMNGVYDLTVLTCERERCGLEPLEITERTPVIDLFVCDKTVDRYRKGSRTLESLCQHYGVDIGTAHNSTADALAAARVTWKLAKRYPHLAEMDLAELHRCQSVWYREQSLSLAAYFRTSRAVEKIDRDHAAGLTTREQADELIATLHARADDVERNADGWPMRRRVAGVP